MDPSRRRRIRRTGRAIGIVLAAAALGGGALSLAGWLIPIDSLTDWDGDGIAIKFNTAVAVTMAALALLLHLVFPGQKVVVRALTIFAAAIGFATLLEQVFLIDLGIDQLILSDRGRQLATVSPGRMGPPAASMLTLIGVCTVRLTIGPRCRRVATGLTLIVLVIVSLSLTGYFFGANELYDIPRVTGIALQTATMIAAIGIALVAAVPEYGLAAALRRNDSGGAMFRRLLVPMIFVALILGWVRVRGQQAGMYDTEFGTAARTIAEMILLIALLWWAASSTSRADRQLRLVSRMPEENPSPVLRLTPGGEVLYSNPAGRPLVEHLADRPMDNVATVLRQAVADSFSNAERREVEVELHGRTYAILLVPVLDEGHVNLYASDITERVAADRKVSEQSLASERLAAIVHSSNDAVVSKDLNGIIQSWNSGAEAIFGYTAEEAVGRSITMLIPEERVDEEAKILAKIRRGEKIEHYETVRVRKDGVPLDMSLTISPMRDAQGNIIGASKIARDMTHRKRAEAAIQARERLQSIVEAQEAERNRIARDLHDHLGQQLTGLRLKLESLKPLAGDNEAIVNGIDDARSQAEQMDRDMSLLAWELRPVSLESLGLAEALGSFVREWSQSHRIKAEFQSVVHNARLAPDVETNLYRIAQEALNNILKHAQATQVSVTLNQNAREAVLVIEDDGRGFDPLDTGPHADGGLGLVGMRERAVLLGGRVEIESSPGNGTTIYARIPVHPAAKPKKAVGGKE